MEIKNIFELINFYNKYVFADDIINSIEPDYLPEYYKTHLYNMFYISGLFEKYGNEIKSIYFIMDELLPDYIYINNNIYLFLIDNEYEIVSLIDTFGNGTN